MPIGSQEKRQGVFLSIEEFSRSHPGAVFAVTFLVVCIAAYLGSRVRLDTDILALVPKGDRAVDAFKTSLQAFGGADYIAALIEAPPGHTADEFQDFADLFAEKVSAVDGVQTVDYRLGGNDALLDLFRKHAVLFLPPEDLPGLSERLSDEAIGRKVAEDLRLLKSLSSTFAKELVRNDPLGIGSLFWSRLGRGQGAVRVNPDGEGYYLSEDASTLLVIIKPARPAQNLGFTSHLMAGLARAEAETRAELSADGGAPGLEDVKVDYAGTYIVALSDSELIKSDMRLTAFFSFGGVLALYLIGYRRMGALFYSSVPLLVGQVLTFAVAFLVFGRINSASSGFVAMVMGLGTDFTIVMYARYVEERLAGRTLGESSRRMMGEGALGMFTGAITSAGTFYSMCVTEFRGLWELGFLIGTGILLSMVAILFLLPAMIQFNEGRPRKRDVVQKLHIQSFGFERIMPWAAARPGLTLTSLSIVTLVLGIAAWNVGFSDNVSDLRSPNNKGVLAGEKLSSKFAGDLNFMMAIVEAGTSDEALERVRAVELAAAPFHERGVVRGIDSIGVYLPSRSRQQAVIDGLRAGAGPGGPFDVARIDASLTSALEREGFRADAFDAWRTDFKEMMASGKPIGVEELESHNLGGLLGRYVRQVEGPDGVLRWRSAVYLHLEKGKWRRDAPPGLVEALESLGPDITVTGVNVVSKRLRTIFARDAKIAITVGILLVSLLLWLDFRSLRLTVFANLQVMTGVVWMMGVMSLAGVEMNFINCFVATMILGVGVDYGIHLIHRMRFNGGVVDAGVMETGKAVAMATLTNVVGFGSLALSNFPGLRSVGIISSVGSVACLITALTLLPALMSPRAPIAGGGRPDEPVAP